MILLCMNCIGINTHAYIYILDSTVVFALHVYIIYAYLCFELLWVGDLAFYILFDDMVKSTYCIL